MKGPAMFDPVQEAAAFWGLAENRHYPPSDRLACALKALDYYGRVSGSDPAPEAAYAPPVDGRQPETQLATDLVRAEAAIARVRALHVRYGPDGLANADACRECGDDWPCPTIDALDGAQ